LGHSTRKRIRWFKSLFGDSVSAQTVSNIVKELDQGVQEFHRRQLGDTYRFLYLDGLEITFLPAKDWQAGRDKRWKLRGDSIKWSTGIVRSDSQSIHVTASGPSHFMMNSLGIKT